MGVSPLRVQRTRRVASALTWIATRAKPTRPIACRRSTGHGLSSFEGPRGAGFTGAVARSFCELPGKVARRGRARRAANAVKRRRARAVQCELARGDYAGSTLRMLAQPERFTSGFKLHCNAEHGKNAQSFRA